MEQSSNSERLGASSLCWAWRGFERGLKPAVSAENNLGTNKLSSTSYFFVQRVDGYQYRYDYAYNLESLETSEPNLDQTDWQTGAPYV